MRNREEWVYRAQLRVRSRLPVKKSQPFKFREMAKISIIFLGVAGTWDMGEASAFPPSYSFRQRGEYTMEGDVKAGLKHGLISWVIGFRDRW